MSAYFKAMKTAYLAEINYKNDGEIRVEYEDKRGDLWTLSIFDFVDFVRAYCGIWRGDIGAN